MFLIPELLFRLSPYENDFVTWESTNANDLSLRGVTTDTTVKGSGTVEWRIRDNSGTMRYGHVPIMYPMLLLDCFHLRPTSDSLRIERQVDELLLTRMVENSYFPEPMERPS